MVKIFFALLPLVLIGFSSCDFTDDKLKIVNISGDSLLLQTSHMPLSLIDSAVKYKTPYLTEEINPHDSFRMKILGRWDGALNDTVTIFAVRRTDLTRDSLTKLIKDNKYIYKAIAVRDIQKTGWIVKIGNPPDH